MSAKFAGKKNSQDSDYYVKKPSHGKYSMITEEKCKQICVICRVGNPEQSAAHAEITTDIKFAHAAVSDNYAICNKKKKQS